MSKTDSIPYQTPARGGSWTRDPKSGRLDRLPDADPAPKPADAKEG